jgi:peptide/nickel transport system permease protein
LSRNKVLDRPNNALRLHQEDHSRGPNLGPRGGHPQPAGNRSLGVLKWIVSWLKYVVRVLPGTSLVGLTIVIVYLVCALFGAVIAPYVHTDFHLQDTLQAPSRTYLFGTDQFGRDIFSRVIVGSRDILILAVSATALGVMLGVATGLVAGYFGGLMDEVIMRLMDIMMSFPSLLLALLILSTMGAALINVILGIAIIFMPRVARVVRSATLDIKTKEFVDAARVRGESAFYIMVREILPNAMGPIVVESSIRISYAILLGASLGFLGLGVQPPAPDWGLQISEGRQFILAAPWVVMFPALAIASLVVGVNLLADGLGRAMQVSAEQWHMPHQEPALKIEAEPEIMQTAEMTERAEVR